MLRYVVWFWSMTAYLLTKDQWRMWMWRHSLYCFSVHVWGNFQVVSCKKQSRLLTNASQKKNCFFASIPATVNFYLIKQCAIVHTSATTAADIYKYRYQNRNTCTHIDRYRPTKILHHNSTNFLLTQWHCWTNLLQNIDLQLYFLLLILKCNHNALAINESKVFV